MTKYLKLTQTATIEFVLPAPESSVLGSLPEPELDLLKEQMLQDLHLQAKDIGGKVSLVNVTAEVIEI